MPLPHPVTVKASQSSGVRPPAVRTASEVWELLPRDDRLLVGAGAASSVVAAVLLLLWRRAASLTAQQAAVLRESDAASTMAGRPRTPWRRSSGAEGQAPAEVGAQTQPLTREQRLKRMGLHLPDDMRSAAAAVDDDAALTPAERALVAAQAAAAKRRAEADAALARAEAAAAEELRKRQLAEVAAAEAAAKAAAKAAELEAAARHASDMLSVQQARNGASRVPEEAGDASVRAAMDQVRMRAQQRISSRGPELHSRAPRPGE